MNLGPESETVEHKKSTSELKEGVSSIAAMLNKHGQGTLYFGVKNNGDVVGQQVSDSTLRDVSQAIGHSIEPRIFPTVEALDDGEGRSYIRVTVEGDEKPYMCKGAYRIRVADEDVTMSSGEVKRMASDAYFRDHPWDEHPSERPLADVSEKELRSFVERGNRCGRITFEYEGVEDTLSRLGLLVGEKMTNAAEVLFCRSKNIMLKTAVFANRSRTDIIDIQQEQGTLFELARKAEFYVLSNIRRRAEFTGELQREEIPELPMGAVREVIINGFAHRSYISDLAIQVEVYPDAVTVFNPGWFAEGDSPEAHLEERTKASNGANRLIARTLFKSKDIEAFGTGMPRVRDLCDEAGVRFSYEKVPLGTEFTFYRNDPFADGEGDTMRENARKCAKVRESARIREMGLSEVQLDMLDCLLGGGTASITDLMEASGLQRRAAQNNVNKLMSLDLAKRIGSGKSTCYVVGEGLEL